MRGAVKIRGQGAIREATEEASSKHRERGGEAFGTGMERSKIPLLLLRCGDATRGSIRSLARRESCIQEKEVGTTCIENSVVDSMGAGRRRRKQRAGTKTVRAYRSLRTKGSGKERGSLNGRSLSTARDSLKWP